MPAPPTALPLAKRRGGRTTGDGRSDSLSPRSGEGRAEAKSRQASDGRSDSLSPRSGEGRVAAAGRAKRLPGKGGRAGPAGAKSRENAELFDQRGYHALVVEHARAKFLQGDYFGAVGDCCREFEGLVRKKSGLEMSGRKLMGKALDPKAGMAGGMEKSLPSATQASRDGAQEEAMHTAMGIMAGPRNSTAHESRESFPIGRDDALDKLTVISYVLKQLEKAGFSARRVSPNKGGDRKLGSGSKGRLAGRPAGGDPAPRSSSAGVAAVELAVAPESLERGGVVRVTITGKGIGGWHVGVSSEEGKVKSPPTRLAAFAQHEDLGGGRSRYMFSTNTLAYAPGEYRVSVSSSKRMDVEDTRIAKFMVTNYRELQAAANEKAYAMFKSSGRRIVR